MTILALAQVNIEIMLIIIGILIWVLTKAWVKDNQYKFSYLFGVDLLAVAMVASDMFAIIFRGNTSVTGYYIVRIANYCNFFFLYFMTFYFCIVLDILLEHPEKGKRRILVTKVVAAITIAVNLINLFFPISYDFDEQNRYFRLPGWYFNAACQLVVIGLMVSVIIEMRKDIETSLFWMLLTDVTMPLIASIVQVFVYGISITNISIGITQILMFLIMFRYQEEKIKERDVKLEEYNAKLMLTQVQPHFMLNTLSTIQYLIKSDSVAAEEAISDFGVYLRNNMEFATTTDLIPFEKELAHIEKYASIEHKRFGDRVKVVYDIKEKDFELPPLSIQPLVENAIKHGISKKRGGGTVELSTWRGVDSIHVLVKDDGVGFDPSQPFSEDRVHLGLSIVGDRLKRMCGGDVSITSEKGKGTICEITIPIEFN